MGDFAGKRGFAGPCLSGGEAQMRRQGRAEVQFSLFTLHRIQLHREVVTTSTDWRPRRMLDEFSA